MSTSTSRTRPNPADLAVGNPDLSASEHQLGGERGADARRAARDERDLF
ncbi:MAG: hypothetical protein K2X52_11665 [Mycobacteriaceae bacterium]|nr:hypothetical protein [Mycobacteriaceae bacterium]